MTNRLAHVERALADGASLVLTPHLNAPLQDGAQPDDLTIMKSGVYNCGFFAAAPVKEAKDFIRWWRDRCRRDAVVDIEGNRFTDQRWVDLAPSFAPHTHILHNPAYNLAYWNLSHRRVTRVGADLLVEGQPIRFVHFSGVSPADRTVFSKHQTRFTPALIGALRPLFEHYIDLLHENGWAEFREIPYAYGRFRGGRPIHPMMRWSFRRHESEMAADPFAGDGEVFDSLEPSLASRGPPGITRVMFELWHRRRDLQRQFDIESADGRAGYLQWFLDEGERTENFDTRSVAAAAASFGRGEASIGFGPWPPQEREIYEGDRAEIDAWLAARVPLNPPLQDSEVPVPRHLALLWEDRPDLQQHFAIRGEAELSAFLAWCLTFGLKENVVDVRLIERTIAPFLDQVLIPSEDDGPDVTRMMQMLAGSYAGEFPHAVREYPAGRERARGDDAVVAHGGDDGFRLAAELHRRAARLVPQAGAPLRRSGPADHQPAACDLDAAQRRARDLQSRHARRAAPPDRLGHRLRHARAAPAAGRGVGRAVRLPGRPARSRGAGVPPVPLAALGLDAACPHDGECGHRGGKARPRAAGRAGAQRCLGFRLLGRAHGARRAGPGGSGARAGAPRAGHRARSPRHPAAGRMRG